MNKTRNRIKLGIEIECCYNSEEHDFNIGGYHCDRKSYKGKNWRIESDGSLKNSRIFEEENTAEFISGILGGKKTFFGALKEFKSFFGDQFLGDSLDFNNSMGCHVHIGLNNNKKYFNKINFETIKKLREKFLNNIKISEILSEDTKTQITEHYFRRGVSGTNYAPKTTKAEWYNSRPQKYAEFNRRSDRDGMGLEWRSVNLKGVKNWDEFDEVFRIIYNCVEWLFKKRTTSHKGKFKRIGLRPAHLTNKQNEKTTELKFSLDVSDNPTLTINQNSNEVLQCVI